MTIETLNLSSLANSSVYVSMSFERFGNSRKAKVEMTTDAVESRFSHSKKLLISPELAAITKADTAIKALVDSLCLPSKHELAGLRMAPNKNVLKIAAILKEYKNVTRPALIKELVAVYPVQYAEAKTELKEHFNPAHFPTAEQLAEEFSFEYAFINFGVPSSLGAISPELLAEEETKHAESFKNAMSEVSNTLLATFAELVNKLNDGLNGKSSVDGTKKNLVPAHVEKIKEFIAGFEAMSSFAPEALKAEVSKMQLLLTGVDVEKIRHSDNLKAELIGKIGQVAQTMVAAGEVKGRFFRKPESKPEPKTEAETAVDTVTADLAAAIEHGKTVPESTIPETLDVTYADGTKETVTTKLPFSFTDLLVPSDEILEQVSPGCTKAGQ